MSGELGMAQPHAPVLRARQRPPRTLRLVVDENLGVLVVLCLVALAWMFLAFMHSGVNPSAPGAAQVPALEPSITGHSQHELITPGGSRSPGVLTLGILDVMGWAIMVVAMMLPLALPMLQTVRKLVSGRADAGRFRVLSAMTFVAVWTLVGILLVAGDLGIRALWTGQGWVLVRPPVVIGVALIVAGLYQVSPLKDRCLRGCRSPRNFALAHWRGQRSPATEVITMTGAYALSCVGCCWALMLIGFAVGMAVLPVMVALALFMAAERLMQWGRHLVRPAGLCLVVLGTVTALDLFPPEFLVL